MFSSRLSDTLSSLTTDRTVRKWFMILARSRDERGDGLTVGTEAFAAIFRFRFAEIVGWIALLTLSPPLAGMCHPILCGFPGEGRAIAPPAVGFLREFRAGERFVRPDPVW